MWYPTVFDITELHERISASKAEAQTTSALGIKAAAILQHTIAKEVFESANEHIAYALANTFLQRNGFLLGASLADVRAISPKIREGVPHSQLGEWVSERLAPEEEGPPGRRILAGLNKLATVVERLDATPGLEKDVDTLRRIGHMLYAGLELAFQPSEDDRRRILAAYPALKARWGEVFAPTTDGTSDERTEQGQNAVTSLEEDSR